MELRRKKEEEARKKQDAADSKNSVRTPKNNHIFLSSFDFRGKVSPLIS